MQVTDPGISRLHDLTGLDLAGCVAISDRGVAAVAERCPGLTSLKVGSVSVHMPVHACTGIWAAAQLDTCLCSWMLRPDPECEDCSAGWGMQPRGHHDRCCSSCTGLARSPQASGLGRLPGHDRQRSGAACFGLISCEASQSQSGSVVISQLAAPPMLLPRTSSVPA